MKTVIVEAPNLAAELRTQMLGELLDTDDLVALLDGAQLQLEDYHIDHSENLEGSTTHLIGELIRRPSDLRAVARRLMAPPYSARFSWSTRLEIWLKVPAAMTWSLMYLTAFIVLAVPLAFGVGKALETLLEPPLPQGFVDAKLVQMQDELVVEMIADEPLLNGEREELVLIPEEDRRLDAFDACHLAVSVNSKGVQAKLGQTVLLPVLDLHFGAVRCPESLSDYLVLAWAVTVDVEKYPGTFLRRAEAAHQKGLRRAQQEGLSRAQVRVLQERAFKQAFEDEKTALKIYSTDKRFSRYRPDLVESMLKVLEVKIRNQEFLVNSVTDTPRHEMILIPGGLSYTVHKSGEKEKQNLADYWIDRYEVSIFQFNSLMNVRIEGASVALPVTGIAWDQAKRYCQLRGLRLPTEAEFEKAATWNPKTEEAQPWPWGNDPPALDNEWRSMRFVQEPYGVGGSPYDVLNLESNVAEWTNRKAIAHDATLHLVKGGSVLSATLDDARPTAARLVKSGEKLRDVGFRCAASREPDSPAILVHDEALK